MKHSVVILLGLSLVVSGCNYKKPRSTLEILDEFQATNDQKLNEAITNLGLEREKNNNIKQEVRQLCNVVQISAAEQREHKLLEDFIIRFQEVMVKRMAKRYIGNYDFTNEQIRKFVVGCKSRNSG